MMKKQQLTEYLYSARGQAFDQLCVVLKHEGSLNREVFSLISQLMWGRSCKFL